VSNALAIATTTEALTTLLWAAAPIVPGAQVTHMRPDRIKDGQTPGINVFLYQVGPNGAYRNRELPVRGAAGEVVSRPRAAVELHYLVSFLGDDDSLEPHRLLGAAIRTLHEFPALGRGLLRDLSAAHQAAGGDPLGWLADSDLDEQAELVRLTSMSLSIEEISKFWNVFFQTPYLLSVVVHASVIVIDGLETPVPPLPVRKVTVTAAPGTEGRLLGVPTAVPFGGALEFGVVAPEGWTLHVGAEQVDPDPLDGRWRVGMTAGLVRSARLQAGVFDLHLRTATGVELDRASVGLLPVPSRPKEAGGELEITIEPPPGPSQSVVLFLDQLPSGGGHTLAPASRPAKGHVWRFDAGSLPAARYVVRVDVGGVTSMPTWSDRHQRFEPTVEVRRA
jgi:hypothetical protein